MKKAILLLTLFLAGAVSVAAQTVFYVLNTATEIDAKARATATDTLVVRKTVIDRKDTNTLEIKIINPCGENKYDAAKNYMTVRLHSKNRSDTLLYVNPYPQMSLVNFSESNLALKSVSGRQAVFIPFAYCGNADDNRQITVIVLYDREKYIYEINLHGEEFQNYKIVDNLNEKFKGLPRKLKKELIRLINSQYGTILGFE